MADMKAEKIITRSDGVQGILLPYPCVGHRINAALKKAREMRAIDTPVVVVFNNRYEKKSFLDGKPSKEEVAAMIEIDSKENKP